jgi:hypothetical protein
MRNFILGIIVCLGLTVLATVGIGDKITANKFNNSTFQVGDVKHSMLGISAFQSIHGDCWKLMDGSSLDGASDLANLSGWTNLPDARGRTLRMNDNGANVDPDKISRILLTNTYSGEDQYLGSNQMDEFEDHDHAIRGGDAAISDYAGGSGADYGIFDGGSSIASRTENVGGNETRMKNTSVNMFIKINNICN